MLESLGASDGAQLDSARPAITQRHAFASRKAANRNMSESRYPGTHAYSEGMATEIRFDNKMTDAEALMWRIDKDPYLSSTFANLSVLW